MIRLRTADDERGVALIMAVVVMVVVAVIAAAVMALLTTGLRHRESLDTLRDRQYAADGDIEAAIADVRANPVAGFNIANCPRSWTTTAAQVPELNGVAMRVDCTNAFSIAPGGFRQYNVTFVACSTPNTPCDDTSAILSAQVNFEAQQSGPNVTITRTYVQSWSVDQ
jgi:type II secretory pathway pseudopilin PulG